LHELNELCAQNSRSLDDFGLPMPVLHSNEVVHEIKQWSSQPDFLLEQATQAKSQFNLAQCAIFECVTNAILHEQSLLLFIDGPAGCGKSFVINVLCMII
jgi:hypothetical protein